MTEPATNNAVAIREYDPGQVIATVNHVAGACKAIVGASCMQIQGRNYIKVEGWQAIAAAHGCTASADTVTMVEGGIAAVATIRRLTDGAILGQAEGFVGEDESMWAKRPLYARRAMAQTRAISRACRSAFAHVVVAMNAGHGTNYSTTPAEEVPAEGFDDRREERRPDRPSASRPSPAVQAQPATPNAAPQQMTPEQEAEYRDLWKQIGTFGAEAKAKRAELHAAHAAGPVCDYLDALRGYLEVLCTPSQAAR